MIKIPIEDMLEKTKSIFKLVILASQRTVELDRGKDSKVEIPKNQKHPITALQEIAEGKLDFNLKEKD